MAETIVDRISRFTRHATWESFNPGFDLKGVVLEVTPVKNSCGNGGYGYWRIKSADGRILDAGITCACGRGCGNTECIHDSWGYHDTVLEDYRA